MNERKLIYKFNKKLKNMGLCVLTIQLTVLT